VLDLPWLRYCVLRPWRRGLLARLPRIATDMLLDAVEERTWWSGLR
jgi:hypothetical protein